MRRASRKSATEPISLATPRPRDQSLPLPRPSDSTLVELEQAITGHDMRINDLRMELQTVKKRREDAVAQLRGAIRDLGRPLLTNAVQGSGEAEGRLRITLADEDQQGETEAVL